MDDKRYEAIAAKLDADASEAIAVKEWPTLPLEALHGLAGDAVHLATTDCEADPAAVLITFLTWFGAACGQPDGRTPYVRIGETRHAPRLFTAVVGASSRARKGTSKYPVQRLMEESTLFSTSPLVSSSNNNIVTYDSHTVVTPPPLFTKKEERSPCPASEGPLSSGEGIIYRLRDPSEETDDDGRPIDKGSADKRLIVIEGELGGVLKVMQREGSIVSTVLRVAWDGGVIEPLTKTSRIRASHPHLCIVGHITADELKALLTTVDLRNGLANRFLWVMARRTRLISRPQPMPDAAVTALATRIAAALEQATPGQVAWSASALEHWDDLYPELTGEREGAWGYATGRAEAQVPRLALIYALLDQQAVIQPEHLDAAYALWRYCDASARYLFAETAADLIGNKILDALREAGGVMTQTALHALFARNLPADKLAAALMLLQEHGRITSETRKTGGRPSVTWRLNTNEKRRINEQRGSSSTTESLSTNEERRINEERDTSFFFLRKKGESDALAMELARSAGLEVRAMLAGQLSEADWSRLTSGYTQICERQDAEGRTRLTALIEQIDTAYNSREVAA